MAVLPLLGLPTKATQSDLELDLCFFLKKWCFIVSIQCAGHLPSELINRNHGILFQPVP